MHGGLNFAPAVTNGSDGYDARSVAVADGKPDLLVANSYVDHVSLYRISGIGLSVNGTANDSGPYSEITFDPDTVG